MTLNYFTIFLATLAQFIVGAIWYTPIFGKLWGKIHGFDTQSKEVQAQMMKSMGPLLAAQFIMTILTSLAIALLVRALPTDWNLFVTVGLFWLGFVVPTQVSAVLFGGTDGKWVVKKIAIMTGGSLACLMTAATLFTFVK